MSYSTEWLGKLRNAESRSDTQWRLNFEGWMDIQDIEIDDKSGIVFRFFLGSSYRGDGENPGSRPAMEVALIAQEADLKNHEAGDGAHLADRPVTLGGGLDRAVVVPASIAPNFLMAVRAIDANGMGPRFDTGYYFEDEGKIIKLKSGLLQRGSPDIGLG